MLTTSLLTAPIVNFEGCLDSNPKCCHSTDSSSKLANSFVLYQETSESFSFIGTACLVCFGTVCA